MYNTIDEYLAELKQEMSGCDVALIQDAQADAREHLFMALADKQPTLSDAEALDAIIQEYGTPAETAAAYKEIERRTSPTLTPTAKPRSTWGRLLSVYTDMRAWGSLLYMFIAFVTGLFYFFWVVTGTVLSLSLLIFIVGIPLSILFLLSVHGLMLLEGRLVEALLGVRMPRRPRFAQPGLKWYERLKMLLADKHTWLSLVYMLFQLPLGIVYLILNVFLILLSVTLIAAPIGRVVFNVSIIHVDLGITAAPDWLLFLLPIVGFALLTLTLHLARLIGGWHGRYAKRMLVS